MFMVFKTPRESYTEVLLNVILTTALRILGFERKAEMASTSDSA